MSNIETLLHEAANDGDAAEAAELLGDHADPNARNEVSIYEPCEPEAILTECLDATSLRGVLWSRGNSKLAP